TAAGIPTWSPTVVLICRSTAYVWQSGRDAQFSADCGQQRDSFSKFLRVLSTECIVKTAQRHFAAQILSAQPQTNNHSDVERQASLRTDFTTYATRSSLF
ncbi:hypothetical protein KCU65_g9618, partial [Aureobasidium melanogenum]